MMREKPNRFLRFVVGLFVTFVVIAGGTFLLEGFLRKEVEARIEAQARSALALPPQAKVKVLVGGGLVIPQLVAGRLEQVDISADSVPVFQHGGSVKVVARGVSVDRAKPTEHVALTMRVEQAALQKLMDPLTTFVPASVSIDPDSVYAAVMVGLMMGMNLPVGVRFSPSAIDGQLGLTPSSFEVAGTRFASTGLVSRFGSVVEPLIATQRLCVATLLPKAFRLEAIRAVAGALEIELAADAVVLSHEALTTMGTCSRP